MRRPVRTNGGRIRRCARCQPVPAEPRAAHHVRVGRRHASPVLGDQLAACEPTGAQSDRAVGSPRHRSPFHTPVGVEASQGVGVAVEDHQLDPPMGEAALPRQGHDDAAQAAVSPEGVAARRVVQPRISGVLVRSAIDATTAVRIEPIRCPPGVGATHLPTPALVSVLPIAEGGVGRRKRVQRPPAVGREVAC